MKARLVLAVILLPLGALAGRQPNPLPVYAADGTTYEIAFSAEGLTLVGRLHVQTKARRFVSETDSVDDCPEHGIGRSVSILDLRKNGDVRWTYIGYEGCGDDAKRVLETWTRQLSRAVPEPKCERASFVFARKGETLTLRDRCDGTAAVTLPGQDGPVLVSRTRRGRWQGRGLVADEISWRIKRLTWRRGKTRLKLSGKVGATRLRGTWRLQR